MKLIGWALLPLLLAAAQEPTGKVHRLAEFPQERTEIGLWMKRHGWKSKRNSPRRFELEGGCLHLVSDGDSVLIGTEQGMPLDPAAWPRLRLRLRVEEVPSGADLTRKSGDDAAFRVYVAFDEGGGWFRPPNTIAYTWTEALAPEALIQSAHYERVRYLSIGRGITTGEDAANDGWVTIERDLAADYRRVFGAEEKVPDLVGFMLKCDTNDTESSASVWLTHLELVSPGPGTSR